MQARGRELVVGWRVVEKRRKEGRGGGCCKNGGEFFARQIVDRLD